MPSKTADLDTYTEHPRGRRAIELNTRDLIKAGVKPERAKQLAREARLRNERSERRGP